MDWNELFDKVKKTSSDAVDKAKDTTKRLATVTDLKSKIRGYNNDKNKLFTQMGMDIYIAEKQGTDISAQTKEFVKKIDVLNARIKKLEERLKLVESSETPGEDSGIGSDFDDDFFEDEAVKTAEDESKEEAAGEKEVKEVKEESADEDESKD